MRWRSPEPASCENENRRWNRGTLLNLWEQICKGSAEFFEEVADLPNVRLARIAHEKEIFRMNAQPFVGGKRRLNEQTQHEGGQDAFHDFIKYTWEPRT